MYIFDLLPDDAYEVSSPMMTTETCPHCYGDYEAKTAWGKVRCPYCNHGKIYTNVGGWSLRLKSKVQQWITP